MASGSGPQGGRGCSRAFVEGVADDLLERAARYRSPHGGLYRMTGCRPSIRGERSDGLEGFARTFLLAAARMRHADPARRSQLAERYAEGLVAGAGGRHGPDEAWMPAADPTGQPQVECAAIAISLWMSRDQIWNRLDPSDQDAVARYLGRIDQGVCNWNNWYLFHAITLGFLASVGRQVDLAPIGRALDALEPLHRADGWYADDCGAGGRTYDYYSGWVDCAYPVLLAQMLGGQMDPERARTYRSRCAAYCRDLLRMIGADGGPLFQGRSLIYRCAVLAPLGALQIAGGDPSIDPGQARRAIGRTIAYFARNGALEADHLPSLGWRRGMFEPMAQAYSGPASPFWLSKAFLGLYLPPEDPLWSAPEVPLPAETGEFTHALATPAALLHAAPRSGIVTEAVAGIYHEDHPGDPLYDRLAYSTRTAPWTTGGSEVGELFGTAPPGPRGADDDPRVARVPDNWAGFVLPDATCTVTDRPRVECAPGPDRPVAGYVDMLVRERQSFDPRTPGGWFEHRIPAFHRESRFLEGVEVRALRFVRRRDYAIGASGFCLSDDRELQDAGGDGWIGVRASDGTVSALIDLTGTATLAISHRGATAYGGHSGIPVALWDAPAQDALAPRRGGRLGAGAGSVGVRVAVVLDAVGDHEIEDVRARLRGGSGRGTRCEEES